jgi:stage IV sporulation protein FB
MLSEPQQTSYDLRFELFGTPVRVHPLFWLFSAILGWPFMELGFGYLVIWVACAFLSILLHEFGHIWMGKAFGTNGYIVLYSFGGLAVGSNDLRARGQRILVSLAGPAIQLVLYGLIALVRNALSPEQNARMPTSVHLTLAILEDINLYWPLLNLLPVWPLDGGMIAREVCSAASPRDGLRVSLMISGCVAAALAINSLYAHNHGGRGFIPYIPGGGMWTMILFASLAIESFQLLAAARQAQPWQYEEADDRLPWER